MVKAWSYCNLQMKQKADYPKLLDKHEKKAKVLGKQTTSLAGGLPTENVLLQDCTGII